MKTGIRTKTTTLASIIMYFNYNNILNIMINKHAFILTHVVYIYCCSHIYLLILWDFIHHFFIFISYSHYFFTVKRVLLFYSLMFKYLYSYFSFFILCWFIWLLLLIVFPVMLFYIWLSNVYMYAIAFNRYSITLTPFTYGRSHTLCIFKAKRC